MSASDRALRVTEPAPPPSHPSNCICVLCLALRAERSASAAGPALTGQQVHTLKAFTSVWNDDRKRRGVAPITAHEALTRILREALDLVGAKGIGT